jgi:hypothetical protein
MSPRTPVAITFAIIGVAPGHVAGAVRSFFIAVIPTNPVYLTASRGVGRRGGAEASGLLSVETVREAQRVQR